MLRITVCMNAKSAEEYFDHALKRSDYYTKELGLWGGKGAERLGLTGEVDRADFVALVRNRVPGTHEQERLTARDNTTREERRFNQKTQEWEVHEVSNRRAGYDFTFSVPKSVSLYLARTQDGLAERLAHKALEQTLAEVEAQMQTRVRGKGPDGKERQENRLTGEMVYSTFIHRESRPIAGRVDPHWHAHVFVQNATYDPLEQRWKAGEFAEIKSQAHWHQEVFHHRLAENLMAAGYGIRRTDKGWELTCITDKEVQTFSKRTRQIEDEARTNDRKLWASARALAKEQNIDVGDAYAIRKAELGGRTRKGKSEAVLSQEEQREDWRQQMGAGHWDALTPELARSGQAIGVLDPAEAKQKAVEHVFRQSSVASEVTLAAELLKRGLGTVSREEAKAWVRSDPRFVESIKEPGRFTTLEILAEESRIRDLAKEGRGSFEPLSQGKAWTVRDPNLDAGQLEAVKLIMENRDLAVAVSGKPGTGKSTAIGQASAAIEQTTGQKPFVLAPSARAVEAVREAADATDAMTVDRLRVDERLQKEAAGRVLFCDESSLLDNRRAEWLLTFARDHGCRLVLWGDERQHDAVERGTPFKGLLEAQALERAHLEKIYRQKDERLLAAVEDFHAGRWIEGFERVEKAGMILEADNEAEALRKTVEESVAIYQAGQEPLVVALQHRHGQMIAEATRDRLKASGLIGSQDLEVRRLEHVDLSHAQRSDPVCYQPGQVVQFHRLAVGGFRSGHQYEVERVEDGQVITRDEHGKERPLPLHQAEAFQVYRQSTLPLCEGERVAITRNDLRAGFRNGDRWKVQKIEGDRIRLENGLVLVASKGLHVRQGYTVTSPASQGHKTAKTIAFLPASAEAGIDAKQMLVTVSRGVYGLSIHTDSVDVLREAATRSGEREAAKEHTQVREQRPAAPVRQTEREPARQATDLHAPPMSAYEQALREQAAQQYPNPMPEQARQLEQNIQRLVQEHAQRAELRKRQLSQPPPQWQPHRSQGRGMGMER